MYMLIGKSMYMLIYPECSMLNHKSFRNHTVPRHISLPGDYSRLSTRAALCSSRSDGFHRWSLHPGGADGSFVADCEHSLERRNRYGRVQGPLTDASEHPIERQRMIRYRNVGTGFALTTR